MAYEGTHNASLYKGFSLTKRKYQLQTYSEAMYKVYFHHEIYSCDMWVSISVATPSQQEWNCSHDVPSCTYEGISFSLFPAHPLFLLRWQARLLSLTAGKPILLQFHLKLLSPRQPCHAVHFLSKESRQ